MHIQCPICTELFDHDSDIAALVCGHTFHDRCLSQWLGQRLTCPTCREQVHRHEIIHHLFFSQPDRLDRSGAGPDELQTMEELQKLSEALDTARVQQEAEKKQMNREIEQLERKVENQRRSLRALERRSENEKALNLSLRRDLHSVEKQLDSTKKSNDAREEVINDLLENLPGAERGGAFREQEVVEYDPEACVEDDVFGMIDSVHVEKLFSNMACLYQKQQNEERWCKICIGQIELLLLPPHCKLFMRSVPDLACIKDEQITEDFIIKPPGRNVNICCWVEPATSTSLSIACAVHFQTGSVAAKFRDILSKCIHAPEELCNSQNLREGPAAATKASLFTELQNNAGRISKAEDMIPQRGGYSLSNSWRSPKVTLPSVASIATRQSPATEMPQSLEADKLNGILTFGKEMPSPSSLPLFRFGSQAAVQPLSQTKTDAVVVVDCAPSVARPSICHSVASTSLNTTACTASGMTSSIFKPILRPSAFSAPSITRATTAAGSISPVIAASGSSLRACVTSVSAVGQSVTSDASSGGLVTRPITSLASGGFDSGVTSAPSVGATGRSEVTTTACATSSSTELAEALKRAQAVARRFLECTAPTTASSDIGSLGIATNSSGLQASALTSAVCSSSLASNATTTALFSSKASTASSSGQFLGSKVPTTVASTSSASITSTPRLLFDSDMERSISPSTSDKTSASINASPAVTKDAVSSVVRCISSTVTTPSLSQSGSIPAVSVIHSSVSTAAPRAGGPTTSAIPSYSSVKSCETSSLTSSSPASLQSTKAPVVSEASVFTNKQATPSSSTLTSAVSSNSFTFTQASPLSSGGFRSVTTASSQNQSSFLDNWISSLVSASKSETASTSSSASLSDSTPSAGKSESISKSASSNNGPFGFTAGKLPSQSMERQSGTSASSVGLPKSSATATAVGVDGLNSLKELGEEATAADVPAGPAGTSAAAANSPVACSSSEDPKKQSTAPQPIHTVSKSAPALYRFPLSASCWRPAIPRRTRMHARAVRKAAASAKPASSVGGRNEGAAIGSLTQSGPVYWSADKRSTKRLVLRQSNLGTVPSTSQSMTVTESLACNSASRSSEPSWPPSLCDQSLQNSRHQPTGTGSQSVSAVSTAAGHLNSSSGIDAVSDVTASEKALLGSSGARPKTSATSGSSTFGEAKAVKPLIAPGHFSSSATSDAGLMPDKQNSPWTLDSRLNKHSPKVRKFSSSHGVEGPLKETNSPKFSFGQVPSVEPLEESSKFKFNEASGVKPLSSYVFGQHTSSEQPVFGSDCPLQLSSAAGPSGTSSDSHGSSPVLWKKHKNEGVSAMDDGSMNTLTATDSGADTSQLGTASSDGACGQGAEEILHTGTASDNSLSDQDAKNTSNAATSKDSSPCGPGVEEPAQAMTSDDLDLCGEDVKEKPQGVTLPTDGACGQDDLVPNGKTLIADSQPSAGIAFLTTDRNQDEDVDSEEELYLADGVVSDGAASPSAASSREAGSIAAADTMVVDAAGATDKPGDDENDIPLMTDACQEGEGSELVAAAVDRAKAAEADASELSTAQVDLLSISTGQDVFYDALDVVPVGMPFDGDDDEEVVFRYHAKLFGFNEEQWEKRGLVNLKLLHHKVSGQVRALLHGEGVHTILAGEEHVSTICLRPEVNTEILYCWTSLIFAENKDVEPKHERFAIMFKNKELAGLFKEKFLNRNPPSASGMSRFDQAPLSINRVSEPDELISDVGLFRLAHFDAERQQETDSCTSLVEVINMAGEATSGGGTDQACASMPATGERQVDLTHGKLDSLQPQKAAKPEAWGTEFRFLTPEVHEMMDNMVSRWRERASEIEKRLSDDIRLDAASAGSSITSNGELAAVRNQNQNNASHSENKVVFDDAADHPSTADSLLQGTGGSALSRTLPPGRTSFGRLAQAQGSPARSGSQPAVGSPTRVCPVCDEQFSKEQGVKEFHTHLVKCENQRKESEASVKPLLFEPLPIRTPPIYRSRTDLRHSLDDEPQDSGEDTQGATPAPADSRVCPMCCQVFPPSVSQWSFEIHVNSHFL